MRAKTLDLTPRNVPPLLKILAKCYMPTWVVPPLLSSSWPAIASPCPCAPVCRKGRPAWNG